MAMGNKTLSGVINMGPGKTARYKTIAQMANERGMKVGVVSSLSLDHTMPACFGAEVPTRGDMRDNAVQLAHSEFDLFGRGGLVLADYARKAIQLLEGAAGFFFYG